jgi:hypothetical protein
MEKPEFAQYTGLDFRSWAETQTLDLTPKFQRREVWKNPARSYFIDSILRDIPIPPIFLRVTQSTDRTKIVREVIDGQQRLRALLDFMNGEYALSRGIKPHGGLRFDALPQPAQDQIRTYGFTCSLFKNISDPEILEVFARVNTHSVVLNSQELRNGRWFGEFRQSANTLAFAHVQFWREYRIFTEAAIARMSEVELTSELMVAELAGQQDKKGSLDDFYSDKDESFPERTTIEKRFRRVIDQITTHLGSVLKGNEFHRPPLFYTLFCVIYHYMYGLPKERKQTPRNTTISTENGAQLRDALIRLSDKVLSAKQGDKVPQKDTTFIAACSRQTDNIKPRQVRFNRLYSEANLR